MGFAACACLLIQCAVASEPDYGAPADSVVEARPESSSAEASRSRQAASFFASPAVARLRVEMSDEAVASLRKEPRTPVRATVYERPSGDATARETVYRNVAVHLKGGAGSFRPVDDRPGLTLDFRHFARQQFHGMDKIHLNNSVQDATYMEEILCDELFRAAGVPAVRGTLATVELNGRGLGMAVLLEGSDHDFLKRYFKETHGNLYDGGYLTDVDQPLHKMSGRETAPDRAELQALAAAANEPDPQVRFRKMSEILDVNRFVTFVAMEVLVGHTDGYSMNVNNYRVYHDPARGRIVFMPHGMDQMFDPPNDPLYPEMKGMVARRFLETEQGRRLYEAKMAELVRDVYHVDRLHERVDALRARIRPVLVELQPESALEHDAHIDGLKAAIAARSDTVRQKLADASGEASAK